MPTTAMLTEKIKKESAMNNSKFLFPLILALCAPLAVAVLLVSGALIPNPDLDDDMSELF